MSARYFLFLRDTEVEVSEHEFWHVAQAFNQMPDEPSNRLHRWSSFSPFAGRPLIGGRIERTEPVKVPAEIIKALSNAAIYIHRHEQVPAPHTTQSFTYCSFPVCTEHRRILDTLEAE